MPSDYPLSDKKYFACGTIGHMEPAIDDEQLNKRIQEAIADFLKTIDEGRYVVRKATSKRIGNVAKQD